VLRKSQLTLGSEQPDASCIWSRQAEYPCNGGQVLEVALYRIQAETLRDHRHMDTTRISPGLDLPRKLSYIASAQRHILPAEVCDGPAELAHSIANPLPSIDRLIDAAVEEDEEQGRSSWT
jgi:hypothetical protein